MAKLWRCRKCRREFAARNQTHTCAGLHTVDHHFLLGLIALGSCADFSPSDDLSAARRRWEQWGPSTYEIVVQRSCYCLPETARPAIVTVREGVVESRRYLSDGSPVSEASARWFPDVPGLFALLTETLANGSTAEVRYDAMTGAPLEIVVDREFQDVDGGYNMYVTLRPNH